jgi:hypothetical protein
MGTPVEASLDDGRLVYGLVASRSAETVMILGEDGTFSWHEPVRVRDRRPGRGDVNWVEQPPREASERSRWWRRDHLSASRAPESSAEIAPRAANQLEATGEALRRAWLYVASALRSFVNANIAKHEERIGSHHTASNLGHRVDASPPPVSRPATFGHILHWQHAEELAASFLRSLGFADAMTTMAGADGGADVVALGLVAQVKNWTSTVVGEPAIRDVYGTAVARRSRAAFFTSSRYSAAAQIFAEENDVALFTYRQSDGRVIAINQHAELLAPAGALDDSHARVVQLRASELRAVRSEWQRLSDRRLTRATSRDTRKRQNARRASAVLERASQEIKLAERSELLSDQRASHIQSAKRMLRKARRIL